MSSLITHNDNLTYRPRACALGLSLDTVAFVIKVVLLISSSRDTHVDAINKDLSFSCCWILTLSSVDVPETETASSSL